MTQKKDKAEDSTPPLEDGQAPVEEVPPPGPVELAPAPGPVEVTGPGPVEEAPAPGPVEEAPAPPKRSHKKRGPYNKKDPYKPRAGHTPPPEPEAPEDPVIAGYRLAGIKAVGALVQLGATINPGLKPEGEGELMAMNAWMAASGNLFVKHRWKGEVSPELAFVGAALGFYGAMLTAERNRPLMERARDLAKDAWGALRKKFRK